MYNTIFNSISYAGGDNRNGWTQKWLTAPIVATSSPLSVLDLKIPKNALIIRAFLNVFASGSINLFLIKDGINLEGRLNTKPTGMEGS